ncbi:DUF1003 domain-containing protein [Fodinicola acaciae]|uniref:DUF1003 domain-containing protein n=1 Tax=Fodinicola acaciae TaxID=2681555 RepID=UPI001C9E2D11|nr:DUF1003 domain-containing protein [Fodinicola acaciae]
MTIAAPRRKTTRRHTTRHLHPANRRRHDNRTVGERIADRVTAIFGSWSFIVAQSVVVTCWIALNAAGFLWHWDPYPFILLNLLFSTQAAYAAPLILLSQNRQADTDRIKAEHDYRVNMLALEYLVALHRSSHGPDCRCVPDGLRNAEGLLRDIAAELPER